MAWSGAIAVLLAGCWILATTDQAYRGQAMFNVLFYRLAPRGADLASLGVAPEEMRYRGMHSYMEGSPANDRGWTEAFYRRTGFARLVGWYARHPASTLGFLWETLVEGAPEMRPVESIELSRGGRAAAGGAHVAIRGVERFAELRCCGGGRGTSCCGMRCSRPGAWRTGRAWRGWGSASRCWARESSARRRWAIAWMRGGTCSCFTRRRI